MTSLSSSHSFTNPAVAPATIRTLAQIQADARSLTEQLLQGTDLSATDAENLLHVLAADDVPHAQKGALLGALRVKGETALELRGLATAMRDLATPLPPPPPPRSLSAAETPRVDAQGSDGITRHPILVDTCGTGGDGSHSLNISTAVALLVAADGIPVAKHGNGSVSSRSGSADVLQELGLSLPADADAAARQLRDQGFAFLFAPVFHAATKAVGPIRKAIAARTVFNLLGPLTNPARPTHQLIGAYAPTAAKQMAEALAGMDSVHRAIVVHGDPGWDEATPCGPFLKFSVDRSGVSQNGGAAQGSRVTLTQSMIDPLDVGIARCAPNDLRGGSPRENSERLRQALSGSDTQAHRDAIALNAGLVFQMTERTATLAEGVDHARSVMASGAGAELIARLQTGGGVS